MKKRIAALVAVLLTLTIVFSFAGCTPDGGEEEVSEFVPATIDMGDDVPVSEAQIIAFYNQLIDSLIAEGTFTNENKPGVKVSESMKADSVKVLSLDKSTGEATESDALAPLNKSLKAIRDRIIAGVPKDSRVSKFGSAESEHTIASLFSGNDVTLDDVIKAECSSDGNNINILLTLAPTAETAANVFGVRDKAEVISAINEYSKEYAEVSDYTVNYVADEENNVYSTIALSVEVAPDETGEYKCTGRITSIEIKMISDVAANLVCKGSFAQLNDVQAQFRFTNSKYYDFDWVGSTDWAK